MPDWLHRKLRMHSDNTILRCKVETGSWPDGKDRKNRLQNSLLDGETTMPGRVLRHQENILTHPDDNLSLFG